MSKKRVSVELDERTVKALDKVAKRNDRSRAWLLRKVLDAATKATEEEQSDDTAR